MSNSIRVALLSSPEGRHLAIEAKKIRQYQEAATRVRQLKQLVHDTFVTNVPKGHARRFDVYMNAKVRIRDLGTQGGMFYDRAVSAVKFAWTSPEAYKNAVEILGN
jgi:hypothetical protein